MPAGNLCSVVVYIYVYIKSLKMIMMILLCADNDMSVFVDSLICLIENESLRLAIEKQAIDYSNQFKVRILVEE